MNIGHLYAKKNVHQGCQGSISLEAPGKLEVADSRHQLRSEHLVPEVVPCLRTKPFLTSCHVTFRLQRWLEWSTATPETPIACWVAVPCKHGHEQRPCACKAGRMLGRYGLLVIKRAKWPVHICAPPGPNNAHNTSGHHLDLFIYAYIYCYYIISICLWGKVQDKVQQHAIWAEEHHSRESAWVLVPWQMERRLYCKHYININTTQHPGPGPFCKSHWTPI
jgi:hypothetical protein